MNFDSFFSINEALVKRTAKTWLENWLL